MPNRAATQVLRRGFLPVVVRMAVWVMMVITMAPRREWARSLVVFFRFPPFHPPPSQRVRPVVTLFVPPPIQ